MKLDLNAKAEAVVLADEEATAEVMVVEAVAGAAVMAEAAVVAVGEGAVAMAVVADAIVSSSQEFASSTGREFFRAFFGSLFLHAVQIYTAAVCCFANALLICVCASSIFPSLYS
jgi:hypothetical protein